MQVTPLAIPDVLLLEPKRFEDARGFFSEVFSRRAFEAAGKDLLEAVVRRANFERRQVRGRKVEGTARHHPAATIGVPVTL